MPDTFQAPTNEQIESATGRSEEEIATNISDEILATLKNLVASNNMPMFIRPVNKIAFVHLNPNKGNPDGKKVGAVGKTSYIHGKSAPENTIAQGLIPVRSSISKAGVNGNIDNIIKYNYENAHSIQESQEQFQHIQALLDKAYSELVGSKGRVSEKQLYDMAGITEEMLAPLVSPVNLKDKNGNQIYIFESGDGTPLRSGIEPHPIVYAIKQPGVDKFIPIDVNHNPIGDAFDNPYKIGYGPVEVQVIGKTNVKVNMQTGKLEIESVRPITADIDILAVAAMVDLNRFDQVKANRFYPENEKRKAITDRGIKFTEAEEGELKKILSGPFTQDAEGKLLELEPIKVWLEGEGQDEFGKLCAEFRKIDLLRENIKSIGHGTDAFLGVVGHLRSEYAANTEISHGAEQFNIDFTQPKDKSFVLIDTDGKVSVINGEDELIAAFNRFVSEGYSIPPNPFWGWKWNEARTGYEKDSEYVNTDALRTYQSSASDEQKKAIQEILDAQERLGLALISGPPAKFKYNGAYDVGATVAATPQDIVNKRAEFAGKMQKFREDYPRLSVNNNPVASIVANKVGKSFVKQIKKPEPVAKTAIPTKVKQESPPSSAEAPTRVKQLIKEIEESGRQSASPSNAKQEQTVSKAEAPSRVKQLIKDIEEGNKQNKQSPRGR